MSPCSTASPHRARKRFGQNFLVDETVIGQIIAAIGACGDHHMIEIGPGTAALTKHLLPQCQSLQAVELDRDLIAQLRSRFANYSDFVVHSANALKTDFRQFYRGQRLRLVGNLPYNISTPLLFHLLAQREVIADMHFMLQREVVDLQTCVFGALYRDELEVCNRSKTALKVQLKPPPELKGYLEFSPAMGFVQARSSFAVQLKLRAAPELLERCAKHMKEGDASLIRIPVRVLVPDQLLPVVFLLQILIFGFFNTIFARPI